MPVIYEKQYIAAYDPTAGKYLAYNLFCVITKGAYMKSFLDFIQLSLFYIDPIARSSRRARAPTNKTGRKGPITEHDT